MDIIQSHEAFKLVDGKYRFNYVYGFIRHNDKVYSAKWYTRREPPQSFDALSDVKELQLDERGPKLQQGWAVASGELRNCYVKTPNLLTYADSDIETLVSREVDICETLRRHPHRNIAVYYGCTVLRGRVNGLCFKNYESTLADRVDPGHLNKEAFLSSARQNVNHQLRQSITGIQDAIRHLHSLGIVHNDITPANIMLEEDGTMVLIDFDSCCRIGEPLRRPHGSGVKRTRGWHDPAVSVALVDNDTDAYAEIGTWLFGESSEQFLFK